MSGEALDAWEARPGDILLLSGNSKTRPLNLGYQSVVRATRAQHTHVALVLTPYRIIHAVPEEGVEIRAWCEVRDQYDPLTSSVARLSSFDEDRLEKLSERARFYFGQRYSILALPTPSETFENQQGIVCSQFVAQVFHDIGIRCTGGGPRRCIPADIDAYTRRSPEWARLSLKDYQYDPPVEAGDFLCKQSRDLSFACDGHAADALKSRYSASYAISMIEKAFESMMTAVKSGFINPSDIWASDNVSYDSMAPANWISVWERHFATPKPTPVFMLEEGVVGARMKLSFIESCRSIGNAARLAHDQMGELQRVLERCIDISSGGASERTPLELHQAFAAAHVEAASKAAFLDRVLGHGEESTDGCDLDVTAVYASGIFESEADVRAAGRCLLDIADWASARTSWRSMRGSILAVLAAMFALNKRLDDSAC